MKTPNLNNYVRLLNEVYSKGKIDGTMIVKNHVNSRSIKSMKNLKFVDSRGRSLFQSQPTLNDIKKILRENSNAYYKRKNVEQTEIPFEPNSTLNGKVYNKVTGGIRTEKLVIRLTKEEKQHLSLLSKKENKTMSKYVVEKLLLNEIKSNSTFIKKPLKSTKQQNISLFWGMIKIKR
jgi:hypothetical protein